VVDQPIGKVAVIHITTGRNAAPYPVPWRGMVSSIQNWSEDMDNDLRELTDTEAATIAGGTDCKTAIAMAQVYVITGDALRALGDKEGAASMYGRAYGVLDGGCPN